MTITAEIKDINTPDKCEVEMYLDCDGLRELLNQLSCLKKRGDHLHFFTEQWGDGSLTSCLQGKNNTLVNHLRITMV